MSIFYPEQVILEVTSHCNLRCKGCALHGPQAFTRRTNGFMPEEIWHKAISEIGTWPNEVNLTTHGGGEPLLHSQLKEILKFAARFSNIKRGFLSNATLLNEEWTNFLLKIGIDWIAFSVDGTNPQTHAIVRKGSNLTQIENNILTFIHKAKTSPKPPQILLNMVMYEEVQAQCDEFVAKWLPLVNVVMLSHYRNPPSSKRWPYVTIPKKPCPLLWSQMVIAWNGQMGLCCEDFDMDECLGDISQTSLIELWNGEQMRHIRRLHEQMRQEELPLCRECDTWADSYGSEEKDLKLGYLITKKASGLEYRKLVS